MTGSTSLVGHLRSFGLSVDVERDGSPRVYPRRRIGSELKAWIAANRGGILEELWPSVRTRILASLPEAACGPGMSASRYAALREYISEHAPVRLVDYSCGIGNVTAVTPPREEVPAGTITMICDTGSYVDGDSRCFTYPDGTPVADTHWVAYPVEPELSWVEI